MKEKLNQPILVVGLGNPGAKNQFNRHNIGFLAVDFIVQQLQGPSWQTEHHSLVSKIQLNEQKILLAKPQTFMNSSGRAVQALMTFYKIKPESIVVIHDDLDLPFKKIRLAYNRGAGGQNGIKSIHEQIGNSQYYRIKCGIGRPPHPEWAIADWVLSNWSSEESLQLHDWFTQIQKALTLLINLGYEKATTQINSQ